MEKFDKAWESLKVCALEKCCTNCHYLGVPSCVRRMMIDFVSEFGKMKIARIRGKWLPMERGYECSVCGWHSKVNVNEKDFKYCPRCGCKMEES